MKRWRQLVLVSLAMLLISGCAAQSKAPTESAEATQEQENKAGGINTALAVQGQKLPDFTVQTVDSMTKYATELVSDQPTLLIAWASWCPDCQQQLPIVEELYQQYKDKVHFIGVNMTDGSRETKDKALQYLSENGYSLPVVFDTESSALTALQVDTIPTMYFVRHHKIEKVVVTVENKDNLAKMLDEIL
ncbi:TlpA disulfide reductase family protein [Streptococcus marmotae]|uniref:TlpA disulfide reductase family protein n=1 Tax=Streptococcus marmotae TaxID=1825069 RepID=UPI000833DB77|nr:TlpA disulfide reductase family protein [Streptococcus marmotae]